MAYPRRVPWNRRRHRRYLPEQTNRNKKRKKGVRRRDGANLFGRRISIGPGGTIASTTPAIYSYNGPGVAEREKKDEGGCKFDRFPARICHRFRRTIELERGWAEENVTRFFECYKRRWYNEVRGRKKYLANVVADSYTALSRRKNITRGKGRRRDPQNTLSFRLVLRSSNSTSLRNAARRYST